MTDTTHIYALEDPRKPMFPWYVGKSDNPLNRLSEHMRGTQKSKNSGLNSWVRSLVDSGVTPTVRILECVSLDKWAEREKSWIAKSREVNPGLLNISAGGNAPPYWICRLNGLRATTKTHAKAGRIGGRHNVESGHLQRISSLGGKKPKSPEARRKMSATRKAMGDRAIAQFIPGSGAHSLWHVKRGITNQICRFCFSPPADGRA